MLKCSRLRCVCAPQYRSAGTSTSPRLSNSRRVPVASSPIGRSRILVGLRRPQRGGLGMLLVHCDPFRSSDRYLRVYNACQDAVVVRESCLEPRWANGCLAAAASDRRAIAVLSALSYRRMAWTCVADREVDQRALRLRASIVLGGHLDLTQRVALGALAVEPVPIGTAAVLCRRSRWPSPHLQGPVGGLPHRVLDGLHRVGKRGRPRPRSPSSRPPRRRSRRWRACSRRRAAVPRPAD